jgi:hypothetical protein
MEDARMRRITERHQNHPQNLAPLLQTLCLGLFVALLVGSWPQRTLAQGPSDTIILSVTAPPGLSTGIYDTAVVSTSWSQANAYTGVSIAVLVDALQVGLSPTAHAYLTTRIGPGTTPMDEIAHAQFTVPLELPICSPSSCGATVTIFSGLSLGPGTYFVTMGPEATSIGTVGWFPAQNPTVLLDAGVSAGDSFLAWNEAVAPYPPASAFEVFGYPMNITVTETAAFAGTPGQATCRGDSVAALARQFGGLRAAASALGFPSVQALQDAIRAFCEE